MKTRAKAISAFLVAVATAACIAMFSSVAAWAEATENCADGDSCTTHEAAIGTTHYDTLAEAVEAASDGATVTLLTDVNVSSQIEIDKNLTIDLNGNTIYNYVTAERLFVVSAAVSFTIDGTTSGSAMVIPETNTSSYGFVKINAAATVTLNGGTYSGDTDNGSFVKSFEDSGTTNVTLSNVTATTNNAFVQSNGNDYLNLTVSGGSYTHTGGNNNTVALFGAAVYYGGTWTFTGVTIESVGRCCIEACGAIDMTITDCNISVTGETSPYFGFTAISVSYGGEATISGSTVATSVGYGAYVFNSGGTITIESGTISGETAAVRADTGYYEYETADAVVNILGGTIDGDVIAYASGAQSATITISGGTVDGELSTSGNGTSTIEVTGGTFTYDVGEYLVNSDGTEGDTTYVLLANEEGTYSAMTEEAAQASAAASVTYTYTDEEGDEQTYTIYYSSAEAAAAAVANASGDEDEESSVTAKISQYKVTLEDYDGKELYSEWVDSGKTVTTSTISTSDPERTEYSFAGWAYGETTYTTTDALVTYLSTLPITTDMTFTATYDFVSHTPGDPVIENYVDATETSDGSYDVVVYCTVDGTELSRETVIVKYVAADTDDTIASTGDDTNVLVFGAIAILAVAGAFVARKKLYVK